VKIKVDLSGNYSVTIFQAARWVLSQGLASFDDEIETWRDGKFSMVGNLASCAGRVANPTSPTLIRRSSV
jgi:hypothetical protein